MRIGGYVPCSLSDFPGRIAAVVFTQGCNWRCPWCHNPALVHPDQFTEPIPVERILERLAERRGLLDGVVISGGEPTLQPGLAGFLVRTRELGLATKLDTNGSHPEVVRTLLRAQLLDFVAMDIKAPWPDYTRSADVPVDLAALQETLALLRDSKTPHLLRTTRWPGLSDTDCAEIERIASGSPHIWQAWRALTGTRQNMTRMTKEKS